MMSVEKLCRICGWDCSDCERVRDSKGNYYCKPCHEAALAQRDSASTGSLADLSWAPDIEDAEDDLEHLRERKDPSQLVTATKHCPGCGFALTAKAILCTECGLDFKTGDHKTAELIGRAQLEVTVPEERVWPILVGGLTLAIAAVLGWAFGAQILELGRTRHTLGLIGAIVCLLGLGVACVGLVGGTNLMRRRQNGVDQSRAWAMITTAFVAALGIAALAVGRFANAADLEASKLDALATLQPATVVGVWLVTALWPAFVLFWFTRGPVKRQMYHHWT